MGQAGGKKKKLLLLHRPTSNVSLLSCIVTSTSRLRMCSLSHTPKAKAMLYLHTPVTKIEQTKVGKTFQDSQIPTATQAEVASAGPMVALALCSRADTPRKGGKDEVNDVTQKVEKRGRPLTRNVKICKREKDSGGNFCSWQAFKRLNLQSGDNSA